MGGTKEVTGYTHLGARDYDPTLGHFLSRDPVVDLADPQQINGYAYSHNSPVTISDPTGTYDTCGNDDPFGNGACPPPVLPPGEPDEDRGGAPGSGSQTAGRGGHGNSGGHSSGGCFGGDRQTGVCAGDPGNQPKAEEPPVVEPPAQPAKSSILSGVGNLIKDQGIQIVVAGVAKLLTRFACKATATPVGIVACIAGVGAVSAGVDDHVIRFWHAFGDRRSVI